MKEGFTYKDAGVDVDAGRRLAEWIGRRAKTTHGGSVVSGEPGYGGMILFDKGRFSEPVLVATADGVGTKLKIAFMMNRHDTVGIDLVAMCVNDLVRSGAEPLFFLDYLATGALTEDVAQDVLKGVVVGCRTAGCALIGGETAEMPGFYAEGEYDLAGFAVGVVEREKILDGKGIRPGDVILGLPSSGLHSNGYSLARRVFFEKMNYRVDRHMPELGCALGEELLRPTKIYVRLIMEIIQSYSIKGIAHITGGGIYEKLSPIMPSGCAASIRRGSWPVPPVFEIVKALGGVDEDEMFRTFNMGLGMLLIASPSEGEALLEWLKSKGENAYMVGEVVARKKGSGQVLISS